MKRDAVSHPRADHAHFGFTCMIYRIIHRGLSPFWNVNTYEEMGLARWRSINFVNIFLLFHYYLPFGLTNWIPFHPRMLCVKFFLNWPIGEEDFKLSSIYFLYFVLILSPLGKSVLPLFEQTWIPFTQGYSVPSWVWNWLSGVLILSMKW